MAPIATNDVSRKIALKVGRTVRRLRTEKGISQERLAELTGHHRTYIGFLERGERTPNVYTVHRIAKALGMSLSELLAEADL